jgi:outer membrane protein assembly factor BamB
MKHIMVYLVLFLSFFLVAGCTSTTIIPTATITITPIPPTPTRIQATATAALPERQPDWTFTAGDAIMSPITVVDGVVYFGSEDHYLYAVNLTTQDLKWKFKTEGSVRSQPAISKDMVYAASDDSYLYAVSISDGAQVWKTQVGKEAMSRLKIYQYGNEDVYISSPTLLDTTVYIGSTDGNLYALDASSGKILWRFTTDEGWMIRNTPSIADGKVFFGDLSGDFYAVDVKEGTKIWVFNAEGGNAAMGSTVIG